GLPRAGDDHRLRAPVDPVGDARPEVLDDDLELLPDHQRVRADEAAERLARLGLVELRVLVDLLDEPQEVRVRRVPLEYVEDEALLDGLAHRVEMEGVGLTVLADAAEEVQRLAL